MNTLVTFNPMTVAPGDSLARVVRLLEEFDTHHLPVVDDGFQLLGIISDHDVARAFALIADEEVADRAATDYWAADDRAAEQAAGWATDRTGGLPTAGEVMTRNVIALEEGSTPAELLREMLGRHIHSLPVITAGRLRGIVTTTDFLREFATLAPEAAREPLVRVMSPWSAPIDVDTTPEAARARMAARRLEYLGVANGPAAAGAVSARLLRRSRRWDLVGEPTHHGVGGDDLLLIATVATVGELLEGETSTIDEASLVGDAVKALLARRRDALAVVDREGRPRGLVTETDLLRALSLSLGGPR